MARDIITGIDIGSAMTRVVVVEQKEEGLNLLGIGQKATEGVKRGYIASLPDAVKSVAEAVRLAEKNSGIPIRKAFVAVGGIGLGSAKGKGSTMISRADSEATAYDIRRAVEQSEANLSNISNRRAIHAIPLSYKMDGAQILGRPVGIKGSKLEVETFFVTCLSQHYEDTIKAVSSLGIEVDENNGVVASPLAASYAVLSRSQKEAGCILVNIGSSTVSVIVFEENLPVSLEVFPIGSINITRDIALGLQLPIEDAERLKMDYGSETSALKRKLSDIIEARLEDIFDLVEAHLKKINRHEMLPGGIILTGGGSSLFSLEEVARTALNLPSAIGTFYLKNNNTAKSITSTASNLKDQILNNPSWAVALGLCIMNSKGETGLDDIETNTPSWITKIIKILSHSASIFKP